MLRHLTSPADALKPGGRIDVLQALGCLLAQAGDVLEDFDEEAAADERILREWLTAHHTN
jgi:hypothetical protein